MPHLSPETAAGKLSRAELEERTREALEERRKQAAEFRHEFGMSAEEWMHQRQERQERQERQAAADRQRSFFGGLFGAGKIDISRPADGQPKADPSVREGKRWFGFG